MKAYLDTSVILRKLLGEAGALKEWGDWDEGCTSELTRVESLRVLDRMRLQGSLDDVEVAEKMQLLREILETADLISLDSTILDRASQSYPTVVGASDAIHLASALRYLEHKKENLFFMTHDHRLGIAAQALGFETRGLN